MDRWEKSGGLGNISLSIYFAMIHSIVWPICQLNFQLMEFYMLKMSQNIKLLGQWNKFINFTPLEYSFYILQFLSIICHLAHLKYLWHFTPLEYFSTLYAPRVFFDILHPRSIFWLWSIRVSPSWVRQGKDEKRSVPCKSWKVKFQMPTSCQLLSLYHLLCLCNGIELSIALLLTWN